ncbi:hypothetical protein FEM48_Zijuj03G0044300 [Ziziphus jujuba var. spinosa]|uniref:HMA domain-containing protein n=1 Tax=Ziziphus jujuba var. spinosa TaxID=714518 RepID=A0A978VN63_ZIZJJ|nr:hypothetical protein FEM48_Zijuj03G0044300 [Ziziphus jujuba var. spinosa]
MSRTSSSASGTATLQVTDETAPPRLIRLERRPSFGRLETIEEEIISCEGNRGLNNQSAGFAVSRSCKAGINPKQSSSLHVARLCIKNLPPELLGFDFVKTQLSWVSGLKAISLSFSHTVVLKVGMSCQGCVGAVKRVLGKLEGVESYDIDLKEQKVTVKGNVQPDTVLQTVSKTGKKTAFWEAEAPAEHEAAAKPAEAPSEPEAAAKTAEAVAAA